MCKDKDQWAQVEEEKAIVSVTRDFYKKIKKYMETHIVFSDNPKDIIMISTWACPKCKTVWELGPLSLDKEDGSMLCPMCYLKEAKVHVG